MPAKVLLIGMDGAEPSLLDRWASDGKLPNLQGLREAGLSVAVEEQRGLGNDATWTSLYSGVRPGRHGRYFVQQLKPGSYRLHQLTGPDANCVPFWKTLGDQGLQTAVIDLPYAPLVEGIEGIQLTDWITHGYPYETPVSRPPALIDEVTRRFGTKSFLSCDRHRETAAEYGALLETLLGRVKAKGDCCAELLASRHWDLFVTVFADSHCIGHQCWHLHDAWHERHDPVLQTALGGDPIETVYRAIDEQIGRLMAQLDADTQVIFFTGPGMGPICSGNFLLDEVLRRLEFGPGASGRPVMDPLKALWRGVVPKGVRARLRRHADRVEDLSLQADRAKRAYFALPHNDIAGVIRINLKGREPSGRVEPGADYRRVCDGLVEDLQALVDLDTGEKIVEQVVRTDQAFPGENRDALPDLLVVWRKPRPFFRVGSAKIGELRVPYVGNRSGDHSHDSVLYARGPAIRPGLEVEPPDTVDVTASIMAALGAPLDGLDGQPLGWLQGSGAALPLRSSGS